jgi:hypothetical protein
MAGMLAGDGSKARFLLIIAVVRVLPLRLLVIVVIRHRRFVGTCTLGGFGLCSSSTRTRARRGRGRELGLHT